MSLIDGKDKEKIWDFLIGNFKSMPSWLRNSLIVSLVIGFFYFGYVRKEIVFHNEKQKTEEIYTKIEKMNEKILKIEEIRIANEDMIYNIAEVREIVQSLSELHHSETEIILNSSRSVLNDDVYSKMKTELDKCEREYRIKVSEIFDRKAKEHITRKTIE